MKHKMRMSDIKVPKHFIRKHPHQEKIDACREYFNQHGNIDRDIVVSKNGVIKDGYVGFLVLQENGVQEVDVEQSVSLSERHPDSYVNKSTMYVYAHHPCRKKVYTWRITNKTKDADAIQIGGKAIVQTKNCRKLVIIDGFEMLDTPPVNSIVKKVIRCFKE